MCPQKEKEFEQNEIEEGLNEKLFNELYEEFKKTAISIAFDWVGNYEIAEEIVDDAFLKLKEKSHEVSNWKGYLVRTIFNKCMDWFKKAETKQSHGIISYDDQDVHESILFQLYEEERQEANRTVLANRVIKALNQEDFTPYRLVFKLRFFEGRSIDEIAGIFNVSRNTVSNRIRKGIEKLREQFHVS